MELVEHHRCDAVEHGIVEDQPGEDALGDDLDPGAARDFGAEPHPQAHSVADALAERLRHALGGGTRGEPARLQHQDAALVRFCAQSSRASTSGTRVVLPAPGGATSTAALLPRSAAVRSGSAASIGSGEASINHPVIPGHREA